MDAILGADEARTSANASAPSPQPLAAADAPARSAAALAALLREPRWADRVLWLPRGSGLLDTLLALRWTHANVDRFGGDATRLTIGGESAGAVATCMHAHSPLSAGLYAQLVMESGDCTGPW